MNIDGKPYRTIWLADDGWSVEIIDQTRLPHELVRHAGRRVRTRRAGHQDHAGARRAADRRHGGLRRLPGAARGCLRRARSTAPIAHLAEQRPTAVNLRWALDEMRAAVRNLPPAGAGAAAYRAPPRSPTRTWRPTARSAAHGAKLIEAIAAAASTGEPVNVLTHCNAGWLATRRSAARPLSPIYEAHDRGHPGARLGRRDAAAQPGRGAHRLRARRARRAAHHHRRQCRRPPDAAGLVDSVHRRHRPRHRATATSPTRSAPT